MLRFWHLSNDMKDVRDRVMQMPGKEHPRKSKQGLQVPRPWVVLCTPNLCLFDGVTTVSMSPLSHGHWYSFVILE